ncbi:MAG: Imm27 family immunity protein [Chloroflexota bacterium]|nr:Imm27 family immunity protein [Chloroflexota bacterium]
MGQLQPLETDLVGQWVMSKDGVIGDATNQRIKWLVSKYLEELATDDSGWEILYRDPLDGRFWELTYPHSEYHGGGPLRLTHISREHVREKYGGVGDGPATGVTG